MVVNEYRKKGGFLRGDTYALSLVLGARDASWLQPELVDAKAALIDWVARRKDSGDLVQFVVTSRAAHESAERALRTLIESDGAVAPLMRKRSVHVSFLGFGGTAERELLWSDGRWT